MVLFRLKTLFIHSLSPLPIGNFIKDFAKHLVFLLSKYDEYGQEKLIVFCGIIKAILRPDIAKLSRSAAFPFCNARSYEQLGVYLNIADHSSWSRTIHKSKGDEFGDVLVLMKVRSELARLVSPIWLQKNNESGTLPPVGREILWC